jgi:hypothetical protein
MLDHKIADLTVSEFKNIIRDVVTQTIAEMLADPDEGLALQDGLEKALLHSMKSVSEGAVTYDAAEVAKKLGLDW